MLGLEIWRQVARATSRPTHHSLRYSSSPPKSMRSAMTSAEPLCSAADSRARRAMFSVATGRSTRPLGRVAAAPLLLLLVVVVMLLLLLLLVVLVAVVPCA